MHACVKFSGSERYAKLHNTCALIVVSILLNCILMRNVDRKERIFNIRVSVSVISRSQAVV